jgi:hypothetical protein
MVWLGATAKSATRSSGSAGSFTARDGPAGRLDGATQHEGQPGGQREAATDQCGDE